MPEEYLTETVTWEEQVRQISLTDAATGGPEGLVNLAPRQLANRTAYLLARLNAKGVELTDFGAEADGDADDADALGAALTAIGAATRALFIRAGSYRLASDVAIPSNVTLVMAPGAVLLPDAAVTLTIEGPLEAPLCQIFGGAGTVSLGSSGRISAAFPQWWGAVGDGVADDHPPFQAAVTALSGKPSFAAETTGKTLFVPMGRYLLNAPIVVPDNAGISIVGEGKTKSNLIKGAANTTILQMSGNNYRGVIKGIRLTGQIGVLSGSGIRITGSGNQFYVEDCWLNNLQFGIYCSPSSDSNFINNVFEYVRTAIYASNSNDFCISGNQFYNCGPISAGAGEFDPTFHFLTCKRVKFVNNRIVSDAPTSSQTGGILKLDTCESFVIEGNVELEGTAQAGNNIVLVASRRVIIANNVFARHYYRTVHIASGANTDIIIAGNSFAGSQVAAYSTVFATGAWSGVVITDNAFLGATNTYDLLADTGSQLVLSGNKFAKGYVVDQGVGRALIGPNVDGSFRGYVGGAPIYGTWRKGDVVWNQDPDAGEFLGWVCTVAGTPGTWAPFAMPAKVASLNAASTITQNEDVVRLTGASAFTTTLPTSHTAGRRITFKGDANTAAHNKTLAAGGAQTIDGAATYTLTSNYESVTLLSDGANWHII